MKKKIKPKGYWKRWENVEIELNQVIEALGHFPSGEELKERELSTLNHVIYKHYGGMRVVRQKLGHEQKRLVDGYWRDIKNVKIELQKAIDANRGVFPTQKRLTELGFSSLGAAASLHHGGLHNFRILFGSTPPERPKQYWKDWRNLEKELSVIIEENNNNKFPSFTKLREEERFDVLNAISRYHGGINAVQQKIGIDFETGHQKTQGYWRNKDNVIKEIERIIAQTGSFPSAKKLKKMGGMGGLSSAITKYYGGFEKIREEMGHFLDQKPRGHWQEVENVKIELQKVIAELGHFPSYTELVEIGGMSGLVGAISQYHGGMDKVREIMSYERVSAIKTDSQLVGFLNKDERAMEIASLVGITESTADIADILIKLWPKRFLSAADLARALPGAVKRIGYALSPFTMEKATGYYDVDWTLPKGVRHDLDNILFNIAMDQYQKPFNSDPEETLLELNDYSVHKNPVQRLAKKTFNYFKSIYDFNIPGHGKLKEITEDA